MATYIKELKRGGFQLQRAIPSALRQAAGKSVWSASGGKTRHEAQRRLSAFLRATDQELSRLEAITTRDLQGDELTDALPRLFDLRDREMVAALDRGADEAQDSGWLTGPQADRYRRVLHGVEQPREHLTADGLIAMAAALKSPASQTVQAWRSVLASFLDHAQLVHPTAATREHALAFRAHLLRLVAPSTAKVRLAYLSGLFAVLAESRGEDSHAFTGVAKRITVKPTRKEVVEVKKPTDPLLLILYFTGARLAEVAGLRREDILEDRILIRPHALRPLKTAASEREIPIHPCLEPVLADLRDAHCDRSRRGGAGLIWPELQDQKGRWGAGLHAKSVRETGVSPKGLRDRAVTVLRGAGLNEAVAARLLGHTPSWMTASYGAIPWPKLVEAVSLLG